MSASQGALLGLGDAVAFTDRTPSPNSATPPALSRREIVSTVEKRLNAVGATKSDLWNRRRMFRRYYSVSESIPHPEELHTSVITKALSCTEETVKKSQSQDSSKSDCNSVLVEEPSEAPLAVEHVKHELQTKEEETGTKSESITEKQSSASEGTQSLTPESSTEMTYHRYYHVFREGELVSLIQNHVEHLHILESYYDNANWCVVAEKVQVWRI